jgi:hypothetical protein
MSTRPGPVTRTAKDFWMSALGDRSRPMIIGSPSITLNSNDDARTVPTAGDSRRSDSTVNGCGSSKAEYRPVAPWGR